MFFSGMLPGAVVPPFSDHTYAQWLERDEGPMSPQPSPFKRLATPKKPSLPSTGKAEFFILPHSLIALQYMYFLYKG